jgi:hypothetical protein
MFDDKEERLMSKRTMRTLMAAGFLLVGVLAGSASAQTQDGACYINTGLFTVAEDEGASFHVSLDDRRTGAPATVLLRLFNQEGAIAARKDVTLQPGQSTTLRLEAPGLYRAHAQILDPRAPASDRRTVLGTVEIFETVSPTSTLSAPTFRSPVRRMMSAHDDGRGSSCPH